jgi:threonylcarbamoyladenosine tRNA methylthiotransferase MtaB
MKAGFYTLGCKLNQCETEALADAFRQAGHLPVGLADDAELYIINTCTVTSKSEQKARRVVRKILADHPGKPLIVTGCYAQVERKSIEELGEDVFAVGLDDKAGLLGLPEFLAASAASPGRIADRITEWMDGEAPGAPAEGRFRFRAARFSFHTRAFLKIQDGCDNHCTYCRVRIARGPSVSLDAEEAVRRFRLLENAGYAEIVLTGVNLSSYRSEGRSLESLLSEILSTGGASRIRLSSLEPEGITDSFADVLKNPRICPHFHLPIQSGSDPVLRAMKRRYNRDTVFDAVRKLRSVKSNPFIAADLIVGFPGESDADHRRTVGMVEDLRPAGLHVFPFSARPGTDAFGMGDRVPERIAGERAAELRALAAEGLLRYGREAVGSRLDVVVEKRDELRGEWEGLSDNYLSVRGLLPPRESGRTVRPGDRYFVKIFDYKERCPLGTIDE